MGAKTLLLVDDDAVTTAVVQRQLSADNAYQVLTASTAEQGIAIALDTHIDLVLLDIQIPVMGGEMALQRLRTERPQTKVVILTGQKEVDLCVRCIKAGASDFLTKPCEPIRLRTTVENVLRTHELEQRLREAEAGIDEGQGYGRLYGRSRVMRNLFEQLRLLTGSDIGVLLTGQSGTGKDLVARALHEKGSRRNGPFVALNCGAIPETMLESELFGHEKGSFTGAIGSHQGCFEQANKGTLFLDEIGEMRMDMQVRLLRVLENREVRRLGGSKSILVDVRVIAATNCDLKKAVAENRFREDLYYRLAVYTVRMPTLAERENDAVELAERFASEASCRVGKFCAGLDTEAAALIKAYRWPGNVRELRNAIERAVLLCKNAQITANDLPEEVWLPDRGALPAEVLAAGQYTQERTPVSLPVVETTAIPTATLQPIIIPDSDKILPIEEEERRIFIKALRITRRDVARAAAALNVSRATLYRRIKELQIPLETL